MPHRSAQTTGTIEICMSDGRRASAVILRGDSAQTIGDCVLVALEAAGVRARLTDLSLSAIGNPNPDHGPPMSDVRWDRPSDSFGVGHALGCNMNPATHGLGGLTCTCGVAPLAGR